MENNREQKSCNGRCEMCSVNQRTYCASQMAYYNQQEISEIKAILERQNTSNDTCIILREKVSETQENTAESELVG